MAYNVSHMIGIRTGGVMGSAIDMEWIKTSILKVAERVKEPGLDGDIDEARLGYCLSKELTGPKGSYVMLAGVFNYWSFENASDFVKHLSAEFGTEVMHMCWDEQTDEVQCQIWLDGSPMIEVAENPIGRILRRVG